MSTYPQKLQEILETLELFPDRADRIQMLISTADRFGEVPKAVASRPYGEEHRVKGCESEAFVWGAAHDGGGLKFHFAVENPQGISAMAMAVILDEGLSGVPVREVAEVPCDVVYQIFGRELSMGKSMGLMGMVTAVTSLARRASEG